MMEINEIAAYERAKEAEARAKERAGARRAFFIVLAVYVVVNLGLFTIDMLTAGGPWFYWPLLGWGLGLVIFGIMVFRPVGETGHDLDEESRIRRYVQQHKPEKAE